jgi:uncharacterized membrane protein YccF (DUF307 family)
MRTLGNILWHIPFLGFLSALGAFLLGSLLVITVIGAPIGLGLIQFSKFLLAPFSSTMVNKSDLNVEQNQLWKSFGFIIRILYFPIGLFFTIIAIVQIVGLFLSLIGIPVALVIAKSLGTYFNPVNKICVPKAVADELERRKSQQIVDKAFGTTTTTEPQSTVTNEKTTVLPVKDEKYQGRILGAIGGFAFACIIVFIDGASSHQPLARPSTVGNNIFGVLVCSFIGFLIGSSFDKKQNK